ncbi:nitric-oxide reductase large subunit [Waddlia chondrophila]|uniref:Nitric oxide reductase, subunit B n=2 Tax=Waddlia chondrophila TaxID=71667 RepID=D6YUP0_WADCW|nr:nitric-oxide reductase large subunit [Waddlia chondrophila]ADI37851.1 nitric oxide reductase, subunit B [Waddlia chondrophila WSU 86-1044]
MSFDLEKNEKISPWWRYISLLVLVIGFTILGAVTKVAYDNTPPIPKQVVDSSGQVIFTGDQVIRGQGVFLKKNLMEHGTLWGHGAYLGPDYSASHLHEQTLFMQEYLADKIYQKPFDQLDSFERGSVLREIPKILKENRYDSESDSLLFTEVEAKSYEHSINVWKNYFASEKAQGLPKGYISDPEELSDLSSFFAWASWASAANRPGEDFTYTNNFPYDPVAGNYPSADAYLWSAISLLFIIGVTGLVLFIVSKFGFGWGEKSKQQHICETYLTLPTLTASQRATGKFFVIAIFLFLFQSLIGGLLAHYRVEPTFYGFPIADFLPYNLLRTWHLQLAIFWIATAWVAAGLFIAPLLSEHEPRNQALGVNLLFGALLIVVVGSLFGEFLSSRDFFTGDWWFWFGNQGSEYLDLGRFWQYLLIVGFSFWLYLLFGALKPAFRLPRRRELSILFFLASSTIPIFYVPAVFYNHETHFTLIDNWRFWIIHLWVEGFFEVFATVLVAIIALQMGIIRAITALRIIYLDVILYLLGGVVGTGHHWYFTGQTNLNMALSACFSAMEVVPLTLLTMEARHFIRVTHSKCEKCGHYMAEKQLWTVYFLIAVGVWNFVGAGMFGFLINLPVISYFEVGTNLTPNHGHAAMFGVFGMLALGATMFCMRAMQDEEVWKYNKTLIKIGFWGLNGGMGLMVVLDLFPAGVLQLWDAMQNGYWHARELTFLMSGYFYTLEWMRMAGDLIFIFVGVVPTVIAILRAFLSCGFSKQKVAA